ncbi:MAG: HDOD domain-containing protein, partial [Spirochaetota bacterium]
QKIESRIKKAYEYSDITQAFSDTLDDTEGAGLGLIMAIMLFKTCGFSPDDFSICSEGNKTISSITIYQRKNRYELEHKVAEEVLKELDTIPSFPENIRRIETICSKEDTTITEIASGIKTDPGLASSILKLANSAGYITMRRIETIEDAVKIIGIKGIKTLLVATGVQHIVEEKYIKYREIWTDSYKKAFYAHRIAIQLKNPGLSETAYLGALLSEIGQIVLLSVNHDVIEKIFRIAGIKDIANVDILEEMTLGISHATLGGLITRKWQFSESLTQSIEYYMRPYIAPPEYRELIYIIHLSHIFSEIEKKRYRFELVDDEVLEFFHLSSKETFDKLHSILKQAYMQKNTIQ